MESQECDWCTNPKQNVQHLIYFCPNSKRVWVECLYFIEEILCIPINELTWSYAAIFTNVVHKQPTNLVNFLVLYVQHSIFAAKCARDKPTFLAILTGFDQIQKIEKYIALKCGRMYKHKLKWSCLN